VHPLRPPPRLPARLREEAARRPLDCPPARQLTGCEANGLLQGRAAHVRLRAKALAVVTTRPRARHRRPPAPPPVAAADERAPGCGSEGAILDRGRRKNIFLFS
jgi:hypothetical protein